MTRDDLIQALEAGMDRNLEGDGTFAGAMRAQADAVVAFVAHWIERDAVKYDEYTGWQPRARLRRWREDMSGVMDLYRERAHLLALLATHYPAELYPPTDREEGFDWALMLYLPYGQASWHIANDDLPLFSFLRRSTAIPYDGHTTDEKYARILREIVVVGAEVRSEGLWREEMSA